MFAQGPDIKKPQKNSLVSIDHYGTFPAVVAKPTFHAIMYYVWEKHCIVLDTTSLGERLSFPPEGVHWAEMLTFTLLNVFLDACSNT